jgi:von Willebrand factor type A domain
MKSIIKPTASVMSQLMFASLICFSCSSGLEETRPGTLMASAATSNAIEPGAKGTITNSEVLGKPGQKLSKKKIKIALLLDTSNSMDGLIDQAKSQLWKLVNELALTSSDNLKPQLEIALYEYGNQNLSIRNGYIRQVSAFTSDLDLISEKLFSLSTNGGDEYCGQVILSSTNNLDWGTNAEDFKVMFIAGNEEFTQGSVSYKKACALAKEKDVVVNTIYCGEANEGINTGWKAGAICAGGEFMSINQDEKTVYIETPYDKEIASLNDKLNGTYVSYGSEGAVKQQNQLAQDANAGSVSFSNTTQRVVSKSSSFYDNSSWDLVDASKDKSFDVSKLKEEELPKEIRGKSKAEKQGYITIKSAEREVVKNKIAELNTKRMLYINEKQKALGTNDKSLDAAMLKAIRVQAAKKNFVFG